MLLLAGGGTQPLPLGWGECPGTGEAGAAEDEYGGIALTFSPSRPWERQV